MPATPYVARYGFLLCPSLPSFGVLALAGRLASPATKNTNAMHAIDIRPSIPKASAHAIT
jgi:hypothetical protein